jgi:hypothetical protein
VAQEGGLQLDSPPFMRNGWLPTLSTKAHT